MAAFNVAQGVHSSSDKAPSLFDSLEFERNLYSLLAESVRPAAIEKCDRNMPNVRLESRGHWNAMLADLFRPTGMSLDAWQASTELLCRCVINAENLSKALSLAANFLSQSGRMQVVIGECEFYLIAEHDASPTIHILQLASYLKLFSWLIDEPIPVAHLRIKGSSRPPSTRWIEALFNCELQIASDRTLIAINSEVLERPLVRTYGDLRSILALPALALIPWSPTRSVESRVTLLIAKAISRSGHAPSLDEIAFQLRRSSSSLRRQLHQEGTSFQLLKDAWREGQAKQLLQDPTNTLDYIATCLGFECTSVFSRAFKSWTGTAPSRFRQAQ